MPKIKVNGLDLNYNEFGAENEGVPIVLVHGLGSQAKYMEALANYLVANSNSHVFTLDLPGYGYSDRRENNPDMDKSYSIESLAKDVVAWLDAMSLKKVVLLGHSMGGQIAQTIARNNADRLYKLILLCTATHLRISGFELGLSKIIPFKTVVTMTFKRAFPKDHPNDKINDMVMDSLKCTSKVAFLKGLVNMTKKHFYSLPWLQEIRIPTLVIGSELDKSFGYDMSQVIAEKISGAILYTIRNGSHEAQVLHTEEVGKAIGKFLTS